MPQGAEPIGILEISELVMKILVLGAGGVGGYFGGRLGEAGQDVTFLVRPKRARKLAESGLVIKSPYGDATLDVKTLTPDALNNTFDLILLCCKSYHLEDAIRDIRPAIGDQTVILPLLNGLAHLKTLNTHFGADHVLGGSCYIAATIAEDGSIAHLNDHHKIGFGERSGGLSGRVKAVAAALEPAAFEIMVSENIMLAMWQKYVLLCSLAGMTCLMRASVGDINATNDGRALSLQMLDECMSIATAEGFALDETFHANGVEWMTDPDSDMTASMMRDMEHGSQVEADHLIGDMLSRAGKAGLTTPLLRIAYCHLQSYERRMFGRKN